MFFITEIFSCIQLYVRLFNVARDYMRYISKQIFVSQRIFSKNFVDIYEIKPV